MPGLSRHFVHRAGRLRYAFRAAAPVFRLEILLAKRRRRPFNDRERTRGLGRLLFDAVESIL
jgi:hypothetical protein